MSSAILAIVSLVQSLVAFVSTFSLQKMCSSVPASCSGWLLGKSSLPRVDRLSMMSTAHVRILFGSWLFKKPFPSTCKEISQTSGRDIQVVAVPDDMEVVVREIVRIMVEVATAVVVDTSPMEDMVAIFVLLTLLVPLPVLPSLLKDVVLLDVELLNLPQVVVMDSVVVWFVPLGMARLSFSVSRPKWTSHLSHLLLGLTMSG